jgi:hypothetical protein
MLGVMRKLEDIVSGKDRSSDSSNFASVDQLFEKIRFKELRKEFES